MWRIVLTVLMASVAGVAHSQTPSAWNGSYGGLSLGGRWADADWTTTAVSVPNPVDTTTSTANFDSAALHYGGFLGLYWRIAPLWVAGVEADLVWADNKETRPGIPGTHGPIILSPTPAALANDSTSVLLSWDMGLRGRIGYLVTPTTLLYANGGIAWQRVEINASCTGVAGWCVTARSQTNTITRSGWTLGGGVESVLSGNWLIRAEYRYADFGSIASPFFTGTVVDDVTANLKLRTHTAFVGLVYRFR